MNGSEVRRTPFHRQDRLLRRSMMRRIARAASAGLLLATLSGDRLGSAPPAVVDLATFPDEVQLDGRDLSPRILEINADHALIKKLATIAEAKAKPGEDITDPVLTDAALLLLDQARILEGESVLDAAAFARRMSDLMTKGLA